MSWFENQLQERKEFEEAEFASALDSIAGAVMGERLQNALDNRETAQSAIEEVLACFHHPMSKEELPPEIHDFNEQIAFYLQPYGIASRTVTLDKGWYRHAIGVMIGTLKEDGSAVTLVPGRFGGYTYRDFKSEKRIRLNRRNEDLLDKEAICFFEPFPLKQLGIRDLLLFMGKQLNLMDIILYFGLMVVATGLGLMSPWFTQWLFGNVLNSGNTRVLMALTCYMVCFSAGRILFNTYRTLISSRIQTKWGIAVEAAVMNRILSLPASFFKSYSTGDLSNRASLLRSLCMTLAGTVTDTGFSAFFSLAYVGQIFNFAPGLVTPSLLILVSTVTISTISILRQMKLTARKMLISSDLTNLTYSAISGIQKIKLAGAQRRTFSRWGNLYAHRAQLEYNPPALLKYSGLITSAISMAGTVILYYLAVQGNVGVANYYAFTSAYGMASAAVFSLSSIAPTIASIKPTLDMARPIMEASPELSDGKKRLNATGGAVDLSHVSFRYTDDMPFVIDDLSLKINPREYVAIVGTTGCGKSTLVRLILGFEKPQKGSIFFDGQDTSKVNMQSLRKSIGCVMQNGQLFCDDIYHNIVIASPGSTMDDAWEAARMACVDEDIKAMPMGMFTMITAGSGGISGGQRQRLMIARALATKPKLLIFDEATSALDNITQRKISDAIDSLACTRIVIAHRLSTIRHADRILYLDKGKIAEEGTYEELLARNGLFAKLVERQRLETTKE